MILILFSIFGCPVIYHHFEPAIKRNHYKGKEGYCNEYYVNPIPVKQIYDDLYECDNESNKREQKHKRALFLNLHG